MAKTVGNDKNVSTGESEGTWKEYDADETKTDKGKTYTATVDGQAGHVIAAKNDVIPETKDATVIVAYQTTLKPGDSGVDPNEPGKDYKDMFADPTRTINVYKPSETNPEVHQQIVWFGRTKTISTDPKYKPIYGNWELGKVVSGKFIVDSTAENKWLAFSAPDVSGYTADPSSVKEQTVSAETKNLTINIHYAANGNGGGSQGGGNDHPTPQGQITINYVDQNGNVVGSATIPGTEGQTTDPSSTIADKLPNGYKIKDGFDVPTNAAFSSTITVPVVKNADQGKDNNKGTGKNSGPTSTPGNNRRHSSGDNGNGKSGNKHSGKTGKHRSGSSNLPLGENGRLGNHNGNRSGGNLAPLGENNGHGQNGAQNGADNAVQNASHSGKTLPQTGENSHKTSVLSTIGMLLSLIHI